MREREMRIEGEGESTITYQCFRKKKKGSRQLNRLRSDIAV
jgi:hypothetical protein